MSLVWTSTYLDPDARNYIVAVEAADNAALEPGVVNAYDNFILGCKSDGIWDAIKASCILCGARTLAGALVPLKGSAPTNNGPFDASDYNRKTGLVGNGSTKYLDTNRANNADDQDSKHTGVYITEVDSAERYVFGSDKTSTSGATAMLIQPAFPRSLPRANYGGSGNTSGSMGNNTLCAVDRSASGSFVFRRDQTEFTLNYTSQTPTSNNILIFARPGPADLSADRIAFYSIGATLPNSPPQSGLELLETRISDFITAIGAAIL